MTITCMGTTNWIKLDSNNVTGTYREEGAEPVEALYVKIDQNFVPNKTQIFLDVAIRAQTVTGKIIGYFPALEGQLSIDGVQSNFPTDILYRIVSARQNNLLKIGLDFSQVGPHGSFCPVVTILTHS